MILLKVYLSENAQYFTLIKFINSAIELQIIHLVDDFVQVIKTITLRGTGIR